MLLALWITALLLTLSIWLGALQRRKAVKTIGQDTVPSIIAAQRIKASLADMDANVVNELLVPTGANSQSIKGYADRRAEVTEGLVKAAENITYGDRERKPIRIIALGLGQYEELAARARTLHERNDARAIEVYRQADQVLQETLYPAIDALTKANDDALTQAYSGVRNASAALLILVVVAALALLAALCTTQIFLSRRMRRTFSLPLLGATLLTLVPLMVTLRAFRAEDQDIKVASEDAYTSIRALLQARAIAYDANTDESRWLLDRSQATGYESAFFDKASHLAAFPKAEMYERFQEAAAQGHLPPGVKGLFADELNNITFSGEGAAASAMVRAYGVYFGLDKEIRRLENEGKHDAAIQLDISMAPGQSNWAFSQFDEALQRTLEINQKELDRAVEKGFADVSGLEYGVLLFWVALVFLSWVALWPRIREYAF